MVPGNYQKKVVAMSQYAGTTGGSLYVGSTTSTNTTTSNWLSTDSTSDMWVHDGTDWGHSRVQRKQLTHKKRLMITALPPVALLAHDGYKIYDSAPNDIIFDEIVNMLTSDGVEAVNNIVGECDFLSFSEINFEGVIKFKDHSMLRIFKDGNYDIMDGAAKIIYKNRNIRDYNKFIDGSSLLEDFIKDCGIAGIKQSEFMDITIEVFIHWLIYKAALKDDDPVPDGVYAPGKHPETTKMKWPHCMSCGRFISPAFVEVGINFCNEVCMLTKRPPKTSVLQIARQVS